MAVVPHTAVGRALVIMTLSMLALSWVTVALRIWVRKFIKGLGVDDWLMAIGLVRPGVLIPANIHSRITDHVLLICF